MAANRSPPGGGTRFAEDDRSLRPVHDPHTNTSIRWLYMGSGILFLATIGLGIWNVFTDRPLPRGQMLAHFHSGTIGWVTLSVIATALWVFTGDRAPSRAMSMAARFIALIGLVGVAGYIMAFFVAFNMQDLFWMLPAAIVIRAALAYTLANFKGQEVVTTAHMLLVGALFVASAGAAVGVLWGLTYSTGISPYPESADPIATHAAPMDIYLALAFAGIVELLIRGHASARWSKAGLTQAVLGVGSAILAIVSLYFGIEALVPVGLLGFLLAFFIYFGRVGWRTFAVNPFGAGRAPAVFWGGLWFPVYVALFVVLVFAYFVPGEDTPHALGVAFVHATFVGMATNLLLAIQSSYAGPSKIGAKLEPTGVWILNVGLLAFFAGEFIGEDRRGALLMALGALTALIAVWNKYSKTPSTVGT